MITESSARIEQLERLLAGFEIDAASDLDPTIQRSILLARALQRRAAALQTPEERRQQRELERMLDNPKDKSTLTQLTDQAFRARTPRRAADQLTHILDVQGVPRFFSTLDRALLKGFQSFGSYLPGVAMPMVKEKMRGETANVILPAEPELLGRHLSERRDGGLRMNVNFLGEALLGEDDAQARLESYLAALQLPEIEVISVKISTIYSQISAISHRHSVKVLCDRLELLYRAAAKERFARADGSSVSKFVYLDMEEYRDLGITLEAFMTTLSRPGLSNIDAGIALQAYLPDSFSAQKQINAWARERVRAGGSPVTIRVVKGANMEMERVEASVAGWERATFVEKRHTDANYKRMVREGLARDNVGAVRLGIATHNLFETAYALVLAHEGGALQKVQFEMLEGMANHQRRALSELAPNVLLYAPATRQEDFINAIGYLIRRLDENAGPDNFLRHSFKLEVGSDEWKKLERDFVDSFALLDTLPERPRRTQNRRAPVSEVPPPPIALGDFVNEPHTDFSLPQNLAWAEDIVTRWKDRHGERATEIPLVIGGERITADRDIAECLDPSRPGVVVGRYRQANEKDATRAVACARRDPSGWRALDDDDRSRVLSSVAQHMRKRWGELMGAALADGGKIFTESDPEVAEAIDFVDYYAAAARYFRQLGTIRAEPAGVVVVVPPWNFPIAIPCGGVAAALAAGNTVILKPASDTVLVAWELCRCFWEGGVPETALQFCPGPGSSVGRALVTSSDVDAVILTGGTATALAMLEARPSMHLIAETGGKNATVVTAMSDREQAIKHVLHSAFSHSGQKCSATSLLVLEAEIYDDPSFKETLCDAVRSMRVGSAWDPSTRMGPMIKPPSGDLERGLKELEQGESWAVMPQMVDDNPCLYSPAVKWSVEPGGYTHMTELFGPVLAVMRADDLHHASELVNYTGYGLTSGLESLDDREQEIWKRAIRAGNLYINRVTTGAIVLRQPFGGIGKSAFGPGIKAGGPNYVAQLMRFADLLPSPPPRGGRESDPGPPEDVAARELDQLGRDLAERISSNDGGEPPNGELEKVVAAIASYRRRYAEELGREHDDARLVGQDNLRRYLPVEALRIRVDRADGAFELFARVCAARIVGCRVTVSMPRGYHSAALDLLDHLTEPWGAAIEMVQESDEELAAIVQNRQTDRLRYAAKDRVPRAVRRAVGDSGIYIADAPVLIEGRVELLWYVREQSISHDYHRYGNLGARSDEPRRGVR